MFLWTCLPISAPTLFLFIPLPVKNESVKELGKVSEKKPARSWPIQSLIHRPSRGEIQKIFSRGKACKTQGFQVHNQVGTQGIRGTQSDLQQQHATLLKYFYIGTEACFVIIGQLLGLYGYENDRWLRQRVFTKHKWKFVSIKTNWVVVLMVHFIGGSWGLILSMAHTWQYETFRVCFGSEGQLHFFIYYASLDAQFACKQ